MRRTPLSVVVCAMVLLTFAPVARAQESPGHPPKAGAAALDCSDFATQRGAQALMGRGDPFGLDKNGNGKACEAAREGVAEDGAKLGAATSGDLDCVDFASQRAAQAHLRANPADKDKLDIANTGLACEIVPVPYKNGASDKNPVARSRSSSDLNCGDFDYQQEAQMVYFRDKADPNRLDDDGNGLACERELPVLASNREAASTDRPRPGGRRPVPWLPILGVLLLGSGTLGPAAWGHLRSRVYR